VPGASALAATRDIEPAYALFMSTPAPFARPAPAATARLVFLCGVASGGTDLLQNVVNGHPAIFMPGEFPFLAQAADRFGASVAPEELEDLVSELRRLDEYRTFVNHHYVNFMADRKDPVTLGPPPEARADGRIHVEDVYKWLIGVPEGKQWTGNKTPTNTENMDKLRRLFPECRFIVIVRDVRDVALSWRTKWGKDDLLAASKWERRLKRGRQLAATMPDHVLFLRYEDLLDDLEATCRQICAFLDLEYTPEMLRFYEQTHKQIAGKPNWGKPLVPGNYGKWRAAYTVAQVRRLEEVAYGGLNAHGYAVERASAPRPLRRWEELRGLGRDAYATLFVGNRHHESGRWRARARKLVFELRKLLFRRSVRY
jgi:hypothetical protein